MPLKLTNGVLQVPSGTMLTSRKQLHLNKLDLKWPKSYSTNTSKEETLLEYVEDFRRQFVQVFPDRRPLLLCPKNEAGVRKFVCSTVRPTLLPYDNLYDVKDCSLFVSEFLTYLPMDDSTAVPNLLPSPSTTVKMRVGDSLDFATLLCSLLRGNGYNAYVVSGYAPRAVTTQDRTLTPYPYLAATALEEPAKPEAEAKSDESKRPVTAQKTEGEEGSETKERYKIKTQPDHESKFLAMREGEKKSEEEEKARVARAKTQYVINSDEDPLHGSRIHFWVLILKGRRDVAKNFFVEPTTGVMYDIADSPYLGIESVWNEQNYWANVQKESPQIMKFNLSDEHCWEYVLIDEKKTEKTDDISQFENEHDEKKNTVLAPEEAVDERDILDCPMSWCSRIVIDRPSFNEKYPGGALRIHYLKCTVEKLADYLDQNGLVLRVTIYQTQDCISPLEVREFFKHRRDNLTRRYTHPMENRTHEFFDPGRLHGLKEFVQISDKYRFFTFYWSSREDGMIRRDERIGFKICEEFENRDDFLLYRSVKVDPSANVNDGRGGKMSMVTLAKSQEAPVLKITEKFARNPKKNAIEDIRKRTHFIKEETIRLDYHYAEQAITSTSLLLERKDKPIDTIELEPEYANGTGAGSATQQNKELLAKLVQKEKELLSKVRERENHIADLLNTNQSESLRPDLLQKSIYDVALEKSTEDDREIVGDGVTEGEESKHRVDYLSPFLAQYPPNKPLTRRQAMTAKDECLATLKERLLERANIIQKHLDAENSKLQQRRQTYKRQAGAQGAPEDEEFTKFYEEAAFRIDILKARLQRHEALALEKYVEMDARLNKDPRLAVLRAAES